MVFRPQDLGGSKQQLLVTDLKACATLKKILVNCTFITARTNTTPRRFRKLAAYLLAV